MITKFEKGKYYKYNGNEAPAHWQSKECPVTDHKPRMCLNVLFDTNAAFEGMGDERACWDWGKDLSLWEEVVTVNEEGKVDKIGSLRYSNGKDNKLYYI